MSDEANDEERPCDPDDWMRLMHDPRNCGGCGFRCPPGAVCVQGRCMRRAELGD